MRSVSNCEHQTTSQPHIPEASDQMMSSDGLEGVKERIDIPFRDCKNEAHHSKSALKEELGRMWWCLFFSRSSKALTNQHPGRSTLHAGPSRPMSDSSSCCVHVRFSLKEWMVALSLSIFSAGRHSSIACVSTECLSVSMPPRLGLDGCWEPIPKPVLLEGQWCHIREGARWHCGLLCITPAQGGVPSHGSDNTAS